MPKQMRWNIIHSCPCPSRRQAAAKIGVTASILLTLCALFALGWRATARAQSIEPSPSRPVALSDLPSKYPLGAHLDILEDPTGTLTIDDVAAAESAERFAPGQEDVPNYGFTDSVYWVRLTLANPTDVPIDRLLEAGYANMEYVDLYTPQPEGDGFAVQQTGVLRPLDTREIAHPRMTFRLSVPPQSEKTVYLRFESETTMALPLTLWASDAFHLSAQREHLLRGLFFGALFGLLVYNLLLFLSVRDRSYLYLVLLMASMIVFDSGYVGYTELYVWPDYYQFRHGYQAVSFLLLFASMLLFTDHFLDLKQRAPKLHWVAMFGLSVWGILLFLVPLLSFPTITKLGVPWALPTLLFIFVAGVTVARRSFTYTRFFLFAWAGLLVSLIVVVLTRLGVLPSIPLGENAYRIGFVWMATCWSLALADRIKRMQAETAEANQLLYESESRLSQTLESLPLGVILYGADRKPKYLNQRIVEIFSNPARGLFPDLSAGRTLERAMEYFSVQVAGTGRPYPLDSMPIYRALMGEPASVADAEIDLIDRRVPLEIWANPMRSDTGDVAGAVVAVQDITRRREAEAKLTVYRNNLEKLVEERTTELTEVNLRLREEMAERKSLESLQEKFIQWLSAVNQAQRELNGEEDLPQAHRNLLLRVSQILDVRSAFLGTWNNQSERAEIRYCVLAGDSEATHEAVVVTLPRHESPRKEMEQGTLLFVQNGLATTFAPLQTCFADPQIQSMAFLPLATKTETIGFLGIGFAQRVEMLTHDTRTLLERMSSDLVTLTTYAQLYDAAKALVASNERNRLARDLHDSVTQVLFSATLVAEVLPAMWRRDPDKALTSLENLRRLTYSALAELRTMLLELRPAAIANTPLPDLLAQLTEALTARAALSIHLSIEQIPVLPVDIHTTFYRVAQEALNNVVKHAQAKSVSISLSQRRLEPAGSDGEPLHEIVLTVDDDGIGYDAGEERSGHLGLEIMRERAAAIGAQLMQESQLNSGTHISLTWVGGLEGVEHG